jgi:phage gpG-like protein
MADVVRLEGIEEVQARFRLIQDRMKNPKTGMELVSISGWKDVIKHFNTGEGPNGAWKEVSRTRKRDKGLQKPLNDTGRLRQSNRWRVVGSNAEVFNQVHYAKYHQKGTSKMVARPFMYLSDKAIDTVVKIFKKYLFEK